MPKDPPPIQREKLFTVRPPASRNLGHKAVAAMSGVLDQALLFNRLDRLYAGITGASGGQEFFERMLEWVGVSYAIPEQDMNRIPASGPVVVVSNHPFGLIDPVVLTSIVLRVRPDVKTMTNRFLEKVVDLRDVCIFVDPFGRTDSFGMNVKPLKETLRWLAGGGLVIIFPAGEVASVNPRQWKVVEPPWSETVARIIRSSKATVVPVFFRGTNTLLFHAAGFVHPRLRTALLPREVFTKRGRTIHLAIGNPIPWRKLSDFETDEALIHHLRERTFLLRTRTTRSRRRVAAPVKRFVALDPIAEASAIESVAAEIDALPPERKLVTVGDLHVYYAEAAEIPEVLREIGRLREITFRLVGEGSGKPLDLDEFDGHYLHLFLWNAAAREVIGAYRMGPADVILQKLGIRGLYTSTLFQIKPALIERINPALELGRSFVRPEYQRSSAALALLWKGLATYVAFHPRYRNLFGPVSISNDYHKVSHQLMVSFLKRHSFLKEEARLVRARRAFRSRRGKGWTLRLSRLMTADIENISDLVADVEGDSKGVPVLIRQYLSLGGKIFGFNVDSEFSNVVDSLILVDLLQTERRVLERYMGKDGAANFLSHYNK
ncbi:lysophospholipid acyltransferase family protein [bacterium]|nr:lysophospholipid acyltransferase family protein [bacterium]MBU1984042.1 lysophospholipid acyltransferase family protein [bacterium]